jgi:type I restriction enzyme, S subunit
MKSNYKKIGDYIREVNVRNSELQAKTLFGINIDKYYMPSVANIVGTDMTTYKVVKKGQFACNRMHVGRDYRLPVALSGSEEDFIVSPAYDVFEIIDENILLPEYLMMWFSRKEFDRNAWFYTDADVRGGLPWKSFCEMELTIPKPDKQKEIIKEYNTIINRINLNNQLIAKLEETAQAIYKHWFVDFEFPDENGKPYKSNGGEMEFNVELQKDIPRGWRVGKLKEISLLSNKKIPIDNLSIKNYISTENMLQNRGGITEICDLPDVDNVTKFNVGHILISNIRPYFKKIWLVTFNGGCSNDILCFQTVGNILPEYLYYVLERDAFFDYVMAGSNGVKMPRGDKDWIMNYSIILANEDSISNFNKLLIPLIGLKNNKKQDISLLNQILRILLSKLATIEN